jgi:transcriptional regulator with XRE-family HTH domain
VVTGSDVRRYRTLIGLTQTELARELGIAQATLSQIEGGRIGVSQEHLLQLREKFASPEFSPSFADFCRGLKAEESATIAAVATAGSLFHTMQVWSWDDRFDLSRIPLPDQSASLVTVEAGEAPRIALRLGRETEWWTEDEIIVFERVALNRLENGELCLVQMREPRFKGKRTAIAIARPAAAKRERILQFHPVSPSAPLFTADESIAAVFRACFRGRYV